MNPHPSHKIVSIKVVQDFEFLYCDYCNIYVTHAAIEKPCRRRPELFLMPVEETVMLSRDLDDERNEKEFRNKFQNLG